MKTKILAILKSYNTMFVSGESLSEMLGVSRTAIWKHIKALRNEGYLIESVTNKGYRLVSETEEISSVSLNAMIENSPKLKFAQYYESIDSTNLEAKRIALTRSTLEGLIVASEQTHGKGRLGRQWNSVKGSGLWMSLLLRPDVQPESASRITLVAATAMCEAIEKLTGIFVGIKWPNDLVVNGRKICGILTEMSAELNQLHYIVLGIGVNLSQTTFEEDLADKATSLKLQGISINGKVLLSEFLKVFFNYYSSFECGDMTRVIDHHRNHSVTIGRQISIVAQNDRRNAYALDIDENGSLIIENENGQVEKLFFGEVSVRGINGYV